MADITRIKEQSRVDAETVRELECLLEAAKKGKITGFFAVARYGDNGYTHYTTDSMHNYAGRGMLMSAVIEEMANNGFDPAGPKIGSDNGR